MRPLADGAAALGALALAPVALVGLALRPVWRTGLRERLGGAPRCEAGAVWVHGASVGEVGAALPLLAALEDAGQRVVASSTTPTGRDVLRRARPDLPTTLAPLDHPFAAARALARVRPVALVLVETELWPSWIAAADRAGIPVVVVSGRISDRSYPRYQRVGALWARTLRRLARIGARAPADAERFVALGADPARVRVTGDLKLDAPREAPSAPDDLAAALGGAPLLVAGSTHAGEEAQVLDAVARVEREHGPVRTVLAPRHLARVDDVVAAVRAAGRIPVRRSETAARTPAPDEVWILDTHGELAGLYGCATLAFVGGTLVPVGGHNVLEPVWAGTPVVYGPHVANAGVAPGLLEAAGAAERVADAAALARVLAAALADPAAARKRAGAGRDALAIHRGAVARSVALVHEVLEARGRSASA